MSSSIVRHLRSNVIGYVALFMAMTGLAYAAGLPRDSVKSKQIKDGQVQNADLAPGAVDASKVAGNSLGGGQIDESSLAQVPSAHQADHAATADLATNADHATNADSAANAEHLGGQSPTAFQQRVTGTCSGGQSVQSIAASGDVACGAAAGTGTVTNVASGTGLSGGPITSTGTLSVAPSYRLPQSCTNNQVAKSNGAGVWNCAADTDTNTTYTAGANGGLALTGTAFSLAPCTTGQVLKGTGATTWGCAADDDVPPNPSSGDLTGSYPNPTLATGAVSGGNAGEIVDNSVTGADVSESSLGQVPSAANADTVDGEDAADLGSARIHGTADGGNVTSPLYPGLEYLLSCSANSVAISFVTTSPATANMMIVGSGTEPTGIVGGDVNVANGAETARTATIPVSGANRFFIYESNSTGPAQAEMQIIVESGTTTYTIAVHLFHNAANGACEASGTATIAS
jgi:hypothetical protein